MACIDLQPVTAALDHFICRDHLHPFNELMYIPAP
jgi:hypothetical protein